MKYGLYCLASDKGKCGWTRGGGEARGGKIQSRDISEGPEREAPGFDS